MVLLMCNSVKKAISLFMTYNKTTLTVSGHTQIPFFFLISDDMFGLAP